MSPINVANLIVFIIAVVITAFDNVARGDTTDSIGEQKY